MPSNDPEKPLVYLVLGPTGSGRRALVADLIDGGLAENEQAAIILAPGDTMPPENNLENRLTVSNWSWAEEAHLGGVGAGAEASPGIIAAEVPENVQVIFFVSNGVADPIDQIEAFKIWVAAQGLELGRVITVVDCKLAEANPPLLAWFDGLIHFSDVVLLNHREGVSNKWMSDFELRYKKLAYPCLFEFVRHNKVHNPALILDEQALRVSHIFEEEIEWLVDDEEDMDEDDIPDGEEEVELTAEIDPYFERLNGGRRVKELPDIRKYLIA